MCDILINFNKITACYNFHLVVFFSQIHVIIIPCVFFHSGVSGKNYSLKRTT